MARVFLILVVAAVIVAIGAIMVSASRTALRAGQRTSQQVMSKGRDELMRSGQVQRLAYVALIIVLFGVTSGWLGGL